MAKFLLKAGTLLLMCAAIFIAAAFIIFVIFSFLLILPGLLLYNLGIKMLIKNMYQPAAWEYNADIKTIGSSSTVKPENNFPQHGKKFLKRGVRKVRDFLNKYSD